MKSIEKLQAANNLSDLARLLELKPKALSYMLYRSSPEARYTKFLVKKSSGGTREIHAPNKALKLVQRRLLVYLQASLDWIEEQQIADKDCIISHGFKNNLSIATNAKNHVSRRWVFNLDLESFFPAINFGRVRGFLIKNKHFQLSPSVATVIAQITCHNNSLPQGAPTSPVISNLIAGHLDIRLAKLARANRCTYTRYADDITFSTNVQKFPSSIGRQGPFGLWEPGRRLHKEIASSGFNINSRKTRMQFLRSRQDVTGLIVNDDLGVKKETLKQIRAQVQSWVKTGGAHDTISIAGSNVNIPISADVIQGRLAHVFWVKAHGVEHKRNKVSWRNEASYIKTHRRFLDYQDFASGIFPTIICEGRTDNIYLRCAILSNDGCPENLRSMDDRAKLGVRLFNYSKTSSAIQHLGGGTGDIKNLIADYSGRMKSIGEIKFSSPVVIVVDNDDGASKGKLNSAVKGNSKLPPNERVDGSRDFYRVGPNLYIVYTPEISGKPKTMIEDFLPQAVKDQQLGGKTLQLDEAKFDRAKHYGKVLLAEQIVKRQMTTTDFSGYLPLLQRISKAIEHFESDGTHA
ncbi:MAG: retron Ec67 family RNA-directed DNA polymerase/endonuclease [Nereida ignava]